MKFYSIDELEKMGEKEELLSDLDSHVIFLAESLEERKDVRAPRPWQAVDVTVEPLAVNPKNFGAAPSGSVDGIIESLFMKMMEGLQSEDLATPSLIADVLYEVLEDPETPWETAAQYAAARGLTLADDASVEEAVEATLSMEAATNGGTSWYYRGLFVNDEFNIITAWFSMDNEHDDLSILVGTYAPEQGSIEELPEGVSLVDFSGPGAAIDDSEENA